MSTNIFRTKSIETLLAQSSGEKSLKKTLGAMELTMLGVGAIIGTGIFVLTGVAAANYSGPALILSFVLSGLVCAFAGLCYAELSAMVPVAGSAYTYGYVALGEMWAWIIGWDLILEYMVSVAAVAIGWSAYFVKILNSIGIELPAKFVNSPGIEGGIVNLPAIIIILGITGLLILGIKESTKLNNILVAVKLGVILLFIVLGVGHVNPINWSPFMPYGVSGVFRGAAIIFFAYIGFDAVSTAAEEVKNPQKDLPKGIIFSLIICTVLYIIVSAILTGMVPYLEYKNTAAPVAYALAKVGINWGSALVAVGAITGITSVLLVMTFGATRVFFALSRDGLLPKVFSELHPKYGTPVKSTLLVGAITAVCSGFVPIGTVAEMANIGTLAAFIVVSASVIILRKKRPDLKRSFMCPAVPFVPIVSMLGCGYLIYMLPTFTKITFMIWISIGFIIYFAYSKNHSVMNFEDNPSKGTKGA